MSVHHAPAYLVQHARRLIAAGKREPCAPHLSWLTSWETALRWQDERKYGLLIYQAQNPLGENELNWLQAAFARAYARPFVDCHQFTSTCGVFFFGGVPPEIPLPKVEFPALDGSFPDLKPRKVASSRKKVSPTRDLKPWDPASSQKHVPK